MNNKDRKSIVHLLEKWHRELLDALDQHFEIPSSGNASVARVLNEMEGVIKSEKAHLEHDQ